MGTMIMFLRTKIIFLGIMVILISSKISFNQIIVDWGTHMLPFFISVCRQTWRALFHFGEYLFQSTRQNGFPHCDVSDKNIGYSGIKHIMMFTYFF
jgi:TRAP-type C4-dicarboxylate transport system substrate-binding protein